LQEMMFYGMVRRRFTGDDVLRYGEKEIYGR
jgi:hypothetical protein